MAARDQVRIAVPVLPALLLEELARIRGVDGGQLLVELIHQAVVAELGEARGGTAGQAAATRPTEPAA